MNKTKQWKTLANHTSTTTTNHNNDDDYSDGDSGCNRDAD
jgi:hypothetical protein